MKIISVTLAAATAILAQSAFAESVPSLPPQALPVPLVSQATEYSCGAASLLGVLYYWKVYDGGEKGLYKALETNEKFGTEPPMIEAVAKQYGLYARLAKDLTESDLRAALNHGDTPILDLQAWQDKPVKPWSQDWDDGHYVVLIAMDESNAYFMDPSAHSGYAFMGLQELNVRWHDWENRHGFVQVYNHSAILIHGIDAIPSLPAPLVHID